MSRTADPEKFDRRLDGMSDRNKRLKSTMKRLGTPFEGIPAVEDFREKKDEEKARDYTAFLTPDEILEAKQKAITEAKRMTERVLDNGREGDVSGSARFILEEAYGQLGYINAATSKAVAEERRFVEKEAERLAEQLRNRGGDEKERSERVFDYSYDDTKGNHKSLELGISADRNGNVRYFRTERKEITQDVYWRSPAVKLERLEGDKKAYFEISRTGINPKLYDQVKAGGAETEAVPDAYGNVGFYEIKRKEIAENEYIKILEQGGTERVRDSSGTACYSVEKSYISEGDFYSLISDSARNVIKNERGLTDTLYEIRDREGNGITVTDARDDTQKENSFIDGFGSINIYRTGADGSREQMTGQDLSLMIKELGLTEKEIKERNAGNRKIPSLAELKKTLEREMIKSLARQPGKIIDDQKRDAMEAGISL